MRASILTIGDEILIGQTTDTNSAFMAGLLSEEGYDVIEHLSVADSRQAIMYGLERATESADLVLITGGLGPTKDDITKRVLADYFDTELQFHQETYDRLVKLYQRFGREPGPSHRAQAELPAEAEILINKRGTAPGMWFEEGGKIVISMPGVPYEMRYLMTAEVMPRLRQQVDEGAKTRSLTLLTAGAGESTISEAIAEVEDALPDYLSLAYLPNLGTVRLRITTRGRHEVRMQRELDETKDQIEAIIGDLVYGYGTEDLAAAVGRRLLEKQATLVTAESCTGGTVGSMLTGNAGSSGYYLGGVVAYSNPLKKKLLGVRLGTLKKHGAVSEQTVREMAEGARKKMDADYAIAVSGIAGPGGGTEEKPVGTVWVAIATPEGTHTKLLRAGKDRRRNITYTALQSLNLLRRLLDGLALE